MEKALFDWPIVLQYDVVSVLFARFHFKVIRKSLYQYIIKKKAYENQLENALIFYQIISTTNSLRKCVEIRLENLNGDIGV